MTGNNQRLLLNSLWIAFLNEFYDLFIVLIEGSFVGTMFPSN